MISTITSLKALCSRRERLRDIALPVTLAALVLWSTLQHGLPVLRHDWRYSAAGDAIDATLAGFSSGWLPQGLGIAQPYPTLYLVGFMLWPLAALHSAIVVVVVIIASASFIASRAAMKIGAQAGGTSLRCVTVGIFAAVNPWVYSEMVAGHIEMVLAYALMLALVAELTRAQPRTIALVMLAALSITQIEFFVVAFVPLSVWCLYTRRYAVFIAVLVSTAPIALGVFASYDAIRSIPYILPWQAAASVPLAQGSILSGYEFGYAKSFGPLIVPLAMLGVFAAYGCVRALRRPVERVIVVISIGALVLASGTTGPIAPLYAWGVIHIAESGVFRELYDLIAIVGIGYVISLARFPIAAALPNIVAFCAAAALCVPWVTNPVAAWTVPSASIPLAAVANMPETRVALFPAFQPLSFEGRGSGFDPDAFVRAGKADPLNEFYPTFPVDVALARAQFAGDTRALAALGVTQVIARPYLRSRWEGLRYQLIEPRRLPRADRIRNRSVAGWPLLAVGRAPTIVSIGADPSENAVFFADLNRAERRRFGVPDTARLIRYEPSRTSLNPHTGWVDARLSLALRPQWGTALGGVLTSTNASLDTKDAVAILAQSSDAIVTDRGALIASSQPALHWWHLPAPGTRVRCRGDCVVVVGATWFPALREHAASASYRPVEATTFSPWFVAARVSPGDTGTLRYAVRYDRHWIALYRGRVLPHVRIAMALNGWLIDRSVNGTIYIVEWVALMQAVLEMSCIAVLAALTFSLLVGHARRDNASNSCAGVQRSTGRFLRVVSRVGAKDGAKWG